MAEGARKTNRIWKTNRRKNYSHGHNVLCQVYSLASFTTVSFFTPFLTT